MLNVGKLNTLSIIRCDDAIYLDGGEYGEIVLPLAEAPANLHLGDQLAVFIYHGAKGQYHATTMMPFAQVDEIAYLKVVAVNDTGAFLDWGLLKNLLVPYSEQRVRMQLGRYYFVKLFLDEKNRITATSKFERFIIDTAFYFKTGEKVEALIVEKTELGIKAIVNHAYWGVFYENEVFETLQKGQKVSAYIQQIRPDNKIDLSLYPPGYRKVEELTDKILRVLQENQGYLALSDKSPAEKIYATFGVSKKTFKQAIGALFKQQKIFLDKQGIRLL